jgi:hypothetical protein
VKEVRRLEVIAGTRRRHQFTEDFKAQVVGEIVSAWCRRFGHSSPTRAHAAAGVHWAPKTGRFVHWGKDDAASAGTYTGGQARKPVEFRKVAEGLAAQVCEQMPAIRSRVPLSDLWSRSDAQVGLPAYRRELPL